MYRPDLNSFISITILKLGLLSLSYTIPLFHFSAKKWNKEIAISFYNGKSEITTLITSCTNIPLSINPFLYIPKISTIQKITGDSGFETKTINPHLSINKIRILSADVSLLSSECQQIFRFQTVIQRILLIYF